MSLNSSYSQTEDSYLPVNMEVQRGVRENSYLPVNMEVQRRARDPQEANLNLSSLSSSINSINSQPGDLRPDPRHDPRLQYTQWSGSQLSPGNLHAGPPPLPSYYQPSYQPLPPHLTRINYNAGYGAPHFPVIMTDELVSGTQHNGRMSPVRRFYLLLCTFDLLFTSLLWIISVLVTGKDLYTELDFQVVHYEIGSSMFDCVIAATCRFSLNLVFYGILHISHWWVITLSTTSTVAFLVAKVLKFQFSKYQPLTYNVMLVLLSFIITWGEVWFFDLRMIPLERKAREMWGDQGEKTEEDERTPLIGNQGHQGAAGGMLQRFMEGSTLYEGSVGNFYSPFESPEVSDDEDDQSDNHGVKIPRRFRRKPDHPFSEQEKEYKKLAEQILQTAWQTLNSPDWKLERKLDNGDMVQVKTLKGKKLFKLTGYVEMSPKQLLEELFYKLEEVPRWNPTLTDSRIIQPIDEFTDISYQVCAEAGGGVVSVRDFVNLRHWAVMEGGVFVSAGGSISHPAMPPQQKKVRGENGPGCWAMRPVEGNNNMCLFQWLLDTDLKGWIPQSIIDKALSGAQLDYIANIRKRAASLASGANLNTSIASCEDILVNT